MRYLFIVLFSLVSVCILAKEYKVIDTQSVKKLIDEKGDYLLIDSLTSIHYNVEHVPTSINIQNNQVKNNINLLPKDKNKMLIFYCMGAKCFFSKNNAKQALELGYKNVYVWEAGIPDWKKNGYKTEKGGEILPLAELNLITPLDLNKNLDKITLISLFPKKTLNGLILDSKVINILELTQKYNQIPKDKIIVFYSLRGKIDKIAIRYLLSKGYRLGNLYYLKGGITSWKTSGFKLEK